MDEVWAVLGISGCVSCCCSDSNMDKVDLVSPPRSFADSLQTIWKARRLKSQRGNSERVDAMMAAKRLHPLHLHQANPFMLLPHADVECFPMDWLHGVYVLLGCFLGSLFARLNLI